MAELSFELFNNQLLKIIVGVNDENIRLIEPNVVVIYKIPNDEKLG